MLGDFVMKFCLPVLRIWIALLIIMDSAVDAVVSGRSNEEHQLFGGRQHQEGMSGRRPMLGC